LQFVFANIRPLTTWPRDWSPDVCSSDLAADHRFAVISVDQLAEHRRDLAAATPRTKAPLLLSPRDRGDGDDPPSPLRPRVLAQLAERGGEGGAQPTGGIGRQVGDEAVAGTTLLFDG